uniref:RING-type domain-containing protein n=1 Tax=Oreochromis niloticus TaxID=8128 RepID=A0A669ERL5_ORENI
PVSHPIVYSREQLLALGNRRVLSEERPKIPTELQKEFNRLLAEAARQQNNVPGQDNLQGVAMCVICLNQPCICVLLDCGHVCCCHTCYQALPQQYCPICRQRIVRVLPLYQV